MSNEFFKQATGVWAYINQDDVRQQIKAGYASADGYEKDWSEATRRQWSISISICASTAKQYQMMGVNCLVDLYATPSDFENWKRALGDCEYDLVVLMPDEQTAVKRNASRKPPAKLTDKKILEAHRNIAQWQKETIKIIDTTNHDIEDTVTALLAISRS